MSSHSDDHDAAGTTQLNDRGRLTIPKAVREKLQLDAGDEFDVVIEDGDIRLVRVLPELETITTGKTDEEWEGVAFHDAGEATFGGTE